MNTRLHPSNDSPVRYNKLSESKRSNTPSLVEYRVLSDNIADYGRTCWLQGGEIAQRAENTD